ncbi:MAG TPA: amino acid racemase [Myxococcota bacterium]|nr:amino acid racemase [Myxococcota bacterium]
MPTAKHVGIVAVSAEGAALCYRTLCTEGAELLGPHAHPEVTLHTFPLAAYMEHANAGRWDLAGELLLASAQKLAGAGAQLLVCPDNTLHQALDLVRARSPLPFLHIAEEVARAAREQAFKKVGVLGTRLLMEGPVYAGPFAAADIEKVIPNEEDRAKIDQIIFDELVNGRFESISRRFLGRVIRRLQKAGCDAVALSCTELPLLIGAADSPLPVLDSTRALARAALREAVA